jgi:hypothetical protein
VCGGAGELEDFWGVFFFFLSVSFSDFSDFFLSHYRRVSEV